MRHRKVVITHHFSSTEFFLYILNIVLTKIISPKLSKNVRLSSHFSRFSYFFAQKMYTFLQNNFRKNPTADHSPERGKVLVQRFFQRWHEPTIETSAPEKNCVHLMPTHLLDVSHLVHTHLLYQQEEVWWSKVVSVPA